MRWLAATTSVLTQAVALRTGHGISQQLVRTLVVAEHDVRRRVDEQGKRQPLIVAGEPRNRRACIGQHRADTVAAHRRA